MGGACHINVHTCYGMCVKDTFAFLLTEYMPLGSLFGVLHDKAMDLTFHRQSAIGIQAAAGLAHLHSFLPPIVHRDVKSLNYLLDDEFRTVLSDFGCARHIDRENVMTRCGSPAWVAPEVLRGFHYDESADVYAFGILLWELGTRQEPFKDATNTLNLMERICDGLRPAYPKQSPRGDDTWLGGRYESWVRLSMQCWQDDPRERPNMTHVVRDLLLLKEH